MKSSKFWLFIPLLLTALILCNRPQVANAADGVESANFSTPAPSAEVTYVCVQLKDFPLGILWRLRSMASDIKQEIPRGLSVGREKIKDQGYLLFSYQEKEDGVLLTMSFQLLTETPSDVKLVSEALSSISQQRVLTNPSSGMITETLRDLFSSFCLAWEKNGSPAHEEEIVLWGKKSNRTS